MLQIFYGNHRDKVLAAYRQALKSAVAVPDNANLEELAAGSSMFGDNFVLLEHDIDKELLAKLRELGAELNEYNYSDQEKKAKKKLESDLQSRIYKFSDALLIRDRRALWVGYHRAISQGFDPEELFWKLSWQVKNILLASKTKSADEASMHPFVYSKSKQASQKFTEPELVGLSSSLLDLWHETHSGKKELPLALEQFILQV